MSDSPAQLLARIGTWWQQRALRERQLIAAAAVLLIIGLLWTLHSWTQREARRLDRALPISQAALRAMQDDAAELDRLRAQPEKVRSDAARWVPVLQDAARRHGLSLELRGEIGSVSASGQNQSFDAFALWLGDAQRELGLRVFSLETTREAGGVRIDARLTPQG
ncbi:type II secretion system protein GspM [Uliginosibacterium sp. H1]|uniref:type II secretion system protein GspM n=1 Tax=Uliginosibacterium sp. H1 TaxID=3114757 RepID=UPI002E189B7F|nr:type II secretion system protein GspM [Uliginosibacterium sp. H1]